jgi:hypothetical protein
VPSFINGETMTIYAGIGDRFVSIDSGAVE